MKEDWWLEHEGKIISPRPELIQEMSFEAGVQFYMYSTDRFMNYAESFLKLTDQQEAIEEAREIRIQDTDNQIIIPDDIPQTLADLSRSQLDTLDETQHLIKQIQHLYLKLSLKSNLYIRLMQYSVQ
jgi:hypothetical protein